MKRLALLILAVSGLGTRIFADDVRFAIPASSVETQFARYWMRGPLHSTVSVRASGCRITT
jgi:hypothetical protein